MPPVNEPAGDLSSPGRYGVGHIVSRLEAAWARAAGGPPSTATCRPATPTTMPSSRWCAWT
jgi:hypothetical protein